VTKSIAKIYSTMTICQVGSLLLIPGISSLCGRARKTTINCPYVMPIHIGKVSLKSYLNSIYSLEMFFNSNHIHKVLFPFSRQ
jgi:hypothetical protein